MSTALSRTVGRAYWLLLGVIVFASCAPEESALIRAEPRERAFHFRYEVVLRDLPESFEGGYLWLPVPANTEDQTIRNIAVHSPLSYERVRDSRHGNEAIRFDLQPGVTSVQAVLEFSVVRQERIRRPGELPRHATPPPEEELALWLSPDRRVPIDGWVRERADETVAGKHTNLEKARAIYDHAVLELRYDKSGSGWGNGDIFWACDAKRGNCTDFHALFIGFTRAVGIPARFEIGFAVPSDRPAGEISGYHCWAQFFLEGQGWIPVDASEAHKHQEKRDYFFGAHDENRVLFTVGRDLELPGMQGEPLNFFIYPYAEVDGTRHAAVEAKFHYRDLQPPASGASP